MAFFKFELSDDLARLIWREFRPGQDVAYVMNPCCVEWDSAGGPRSVWPGIYSVGEDWLKFHYPAQFASAILRGDSVIRLQ